MFVFLNDDVSCWARSAVRGAYHFVGDKNNDVGLSCCGYAQYNTKLSTFHPLLKITFFLEAVPGRIVL